MLQLFLQCYQACTESIESCDRPRLFTDLSHKYSSSSLASIPTHWSLSINWRRSPTRLANPKSECQQFRAHDSSHDPCASFSLFSSLLNTRSSLHQQSTFITEERQGQNPGAVYKSEIRRCLCTHCKIRHGSPQAPSQQSTRSIAQCFPALNR